MRDIHRMRNEEFKQKILAVLSDVRKALEAHGGNVELVDADPKTGVVTVRLLGACEGCPMGDQTLKYVVEAALRQAVPEVKEVVLDEP